MMDNYPIGHCGYCVVCDGPEEGEDESNEDALEKTINVSKKQRLVLKAIEAQPEAANDDALLCATVWLMEGWKLDDSVYANLKRCTRPETITRRRRELVNAGLVKPSQKALKERTEAFVNERDRHSRFVPAAWKMGRLL